MHTMMFGARREILASLAGLFLFAAPLQAQNLLVNPDFDIDLGGWSANVGTTWDGTMDADGSPASGSARLALTIASPNAAANGGVQQCVTGIVAGTGYDFSGRIFLTTVPAAGTARVDVVWHSDITCTTVISVVVGAQVAMTGSWETSIGFAVAPPGAVAAVLQTDEQTNGTAGDFVVHFDDLFLAPSTAVPAVRGPMLALFWLSLLAVGVVGLRRLRVGALNRT